MRTLTGFLLLFLHLQFAIFLPFSAFGALKPTLEVYLKGKYRSEQSLVYRSGKVWVCKTELSPYFENPRAPFEASVLADLRKHAPQRRIASTCRDRLIVIDRTQAKPVTVAGCADEPDFAKFYARLARDCGR